MKVKIFSNTVFLTMETEINNFIIANLLQPSKIVSVNFSSTKVTTVTTYTCLIMYLTK